jgi:hypothetical protein
MLRELSQLPNRLFSFFTYGNKQGRAMNSINSLRATHPILPRSGRHSSPLFRHFYRKATASFSSNGNLKSWSHKGKGFYHLFNADYCRYTCSDWFVKKSAKYRQQKILPTDRIVLFNCSPPIQLNEHTGGDASSLGRNSMLFHVAPWSTLQTSAVGTI